METRPPAKGAICQTRPRSERVKSSCLLLICVTLSAGFVGTHTCCGHADITHTEHDQTQGTWGKHAQ